MIIPYSKFVNFVWYQLVWFIAILGGNAFESALLLLILLHLSLCRDWKTEAKIMLSCALIGVLVDTVFSLQGLYQFAQPSLLLPLPLWLMAIWFGFIGTLRHSLRYMLDKPILMTIAAGLAAPLSYLAGMRLGAVEFPMGVSLTLMCISLAWMAMVPIFIRICRHFEASEQGISESSSGSKPSQNTFAHLEIMK